MSVSLNMIDAVLAQVLVDCKETQEMYLYLSNIFMERIQVCVWCKFYGDSLIVVRWGTL